MKSRYLEVALFIGAVGGRRWRAQTWGGGLLASVDGLRFVVPIQTINAAPSPRYFGPKRGVPWLNAVNDQVAGIGAVVVPGTMRDSLHILDTLLNLDGGPHPDMVATALRVARRTGDQLVVTKLDRLGRSLAHLIELSAELQERGVDLIVLDQSIDNSTAMGRMFFQILGSIAEFEQALMSERTHDGLAAARARGRTSGQKPKLTRAKQVSHSRCPKKPDPMGAWCTPSNRSPPNSASPAPRSTGTSRALGQGRARKSARPPSSSLARKRVRTVKRACSTWAVQPQALSPHESATLNSAGARQGVVVPPSWQVAGRVASRSVMAASQSRSASADAACFAW